jgi:hypothetical protein
LSVTVSWASNISKHTFYVKEWVSFQCMFHVGGAHILWVEQLVIMSKHSIIILWTVSQMLSHLLFIILSCLLTSLKSDDFVNDRMYRMPDLTVTVPRVQLNKLKSETCINDFNKWRLIQHLYQNGWNVPSERMNTKGEIWSWSCR